MGWLAVTESQKEEVAALNAASPAVKVRVVLGTNGGWLTNDAVLPDATPDGPLGHFAEWYAALQTTEDTPAPPPARPAPRPRPQ